jgi:uncharacterized membrane protein YadS
MSSVNQNVPEDSVPSAAPVALPPQPSWWRTEDWTSVWIGAAMLVAILIGYRPAIPSLKWAGTEDLAKVFSNDSLLGWVGIGVVCLLFALVGAAVQRISLLRFALAFPVVFVLAVIAQWITGNRVVNSWGFEYVIFSLIIGLLISNTAGTPGWLMQAVRTEYFIKTGLVMMGATILFEEILRAGARGIIQSVAVVVVVWYVAFWICKKFRVDDDFSVMLSTAVSICGVSAAFASCGAIQGDKKKLSYVTSVVLIVAAPMMVLQPWIAKWVGMSEAVAGAWLGGTLDTTGSVVAAAAIISEKAMQVGTIVKFSQNVLLGFAAFGLSLWWTMRDKSTQERPTIAVIWHRFPKFVLGFATASLVFSFLLDPGIVKETKSVVGGLRTMWFSLAFVSIGLETNFREFLQMEEGRPFFAFLGAQSFNLIWTYILALLVFGGVLFGTAY